MYVADRYMFEGHGSSMQNKEMWLAQQQMWRTGFADLEISFEIHSVEGNLVRGRRHTSGTHTGDLDLGLLGMGVVAATGKTVSVSQAADYIVLGETIISCHSAPEEGGGIHSVLSQLGIDRP